MIAIVNACDYTEVTEGAKAIQMLGHSMNAVALPKGGILTYKIDVKQDGDYRIHTAMIPTQPNDHGDLRYSVSVDGATPVVYNLKEPFRSEQWKRNVLCGQALRQLDIRLTKGIHQLCIKALDDHIVVDQWMLDFTP